MTRRHFDYTLFLTTMLLVGIGLTMVYSSSAILAREKFGDDYLFLKREAFYIGIGFVALLAGKNIPLIWYRRYVYPLLALACVLLFLVHVPGLGFTSRGATRWLNVAGFSFQPTEFAKIALVFFMAYALAKKQDKVKYFGTGFLPPMLISLGIIGLVLLGKDLGNAALMIATVLALFYVAGARPSYLIAEILLALPAFYLLVASVDYRRRRILAFLDPWEHRREEGFQLIQSFLAFQVGGLMGVGLGEGRQKLFYLPEAHTDFIFSVIAEEVGLLGALIVMGLFVLWIFRAFAISWHAPDHYTRYLALGLTMIIGWLAFFNMAVVMGLLPTKGIPLPFISYGGTSLVMCLFAVGILLNISTQVHAMEES